MTEDNNTETEAPELNADGLVPGQPVSFEQIKAAEHKRKAREAAEAATDEPDTQDDDPAGDGADDADGDGASDEPTTDDTDKNTSDEGEQGGLTIESPEDIDKLNKADILEYLAAHGVTETDGKVGELRDKLKALMFTDL